MLEMFGVVLLLALATHASTLASDLRCVVHRDAKPDLNSGREPVNPNPVAADQCGAAPGPANPLLLAQLELHGINAATTSQETKCAVAVLVHADTSRASQCWFAPASCAPVS